MFSTLSHLFMIRYEMLICILHEQNAKLLIYSNTKTKTENEQKYFEEDEEECKPNKKRVGENGSSIKKTRKSATINNVIFLFGLV